MINLRYHIVSITAVFLALGIGVTLGSSLIQRYTIDNLETRLNELGDRLDRTDGENRILRDELRERDELDARIAEEGRALFAGHLEDVPVVLLSVQGGDDELLSSTRSSLRAADARISGTLSFTARWDDLSDDDLAELAEVLERRFGNPQVARNLVLRRVAEELVAASGPPPEPEPEPDPDPPVLIDPETGEPVPIDPSAGGPGQSDSPGDTEAPIDPTETDPGATTTTEPPDPGPPPVPDGDIIAALVERGFLEFFPESSAVPLPEFGTRFLLVADPGAVLEPEALVLPLLESLSIASPGILPVVVASPAVVIPVDDAPDGVVELVADPLITTIRGDERLATEVSTVDHLDRFTGQGSVVIALAELGDGRVGHFGFGEGSSSLLPAGAA